MWLLSSSVIFVKIVVELGIGFFVGIFLLLDINVIYVVKDNIDIYKKYF